MSTQQIDISVDRENVTARPTKTVNMPRALSNRPALGELGNTVHNVNQGNNVQKKSVMGPPAAPKQRENNCKTEKFSTTKTEDKSNQKLKREDSLVKKIVLAKVQSRQHSFSYRQLSITDPDEETKDEPQMVTEYLGDIFSHLREMETKYPIKENYMENHGSTPKMRAILVNWLVEVHQNFKLCVETLHICVAITDRYLQINKTVGRETLQLVGTAALYVASKYEEMYFPEIEDLVYSCDDTFSKKQILRMEVQILKTLEFSLGRPLSIHFLRRYSKIGKASPIQHVLGKYLIELALLEYKLCHIKPSIIAAAAACLSVAILEEILDMSKVWTPTMIHYTTYQYTDFKPVVHELAAIINRKPDPKIQSIRTKYAASRYRKISLHHNLSGQVVSMLVLQSKNKK